MYEYVWGNPNLRSTKIGTFSPASKYTDIRPYNQLHYNNEYHSVTT
jgi:hypothetical protein